MGEATFVLAGQYTFGNGEGTHSTECDHGLGAVELQTAALQEEGTSVTTIVGRRGSSDAYFSDKHPTRVTTNFTTLSGADAAQLDAHASELVAAASEDGTSIHYGPLEFRRGDTVCITAGSLQDRYELAARLKGVDGLQDVSFVPSNPGRDEFALGILQCVIFYLMQHAIVDGEIYVCALGKTTHFAFWASNLQEAFNVWHRAAHDVGTLSAPCKSRLLITFKHGDDAETYGRELARDIETVKCHAW